VKFLRLSENVSSEVTWVELKNKVGIKLFTLPKSKENLLQLFEVGKAVGELVDRVHFGSVGPKDE
jgi:hypothetical protein